MNGSENADVWRFERDQCRKQLAEKADEIERLRAALTEIAQYPTLVKPEPGWKKIARRALEAE